MANRALLLSNVGSCSPLVCRRWMVRCSSAWRRGPLIWRRRKDGASLFRCVYEGSQAVTENAKEVVAVSRGGEGKKGWVHFVGIGGYGLSALAMLAHKQVWILIAHNILDLNTYMCSDKCIECLNA